MTANAKDLGDPPPMFSCTYFLLFVHQLANATGIPVPTVVGSELLTNTSSTAMTVGNRAKDNCQRLCMMPLVTS